MSVTIATFHLVWEAGLVKAFLESHRVPCFLADENIVSVNPFYASAVGSIKLNVHPDHEELARRLYREYLDGSHGRQPVEVPDCPACHSDAVLPQPGSPGVYYTEYRCFDCDHRWDDRALRNLNPGHIE